MNFIFSYAATHSVSAREIKNRELTATYRDIITKEGDRGFGLLLHIMSVDFILRVRSSCSFLQSV